MSFFFKRKPAAPKIQWDAERQQPAVRRSICTGEMTGGLVNKSDGSFHEIQLLHDQKELEQFCQQLGISAKEIKTIY